MSRQQFLRPRRGVGCRGHRAGGHLFRLVDPNSVARELERLQRRAGGGRRGRVRKGKRGNEAKRRTDVSHGTVSPCVLSILSGPTTKIQAIAPTRATPP